MPNTAPLSPTRFVSPAKVNLHLHITDKRDDGYHKLHSLAAFTDFGDTLILTPSNNKRTISVNGQFSDQLANLEQQDNLIEKALLLYEKRLGRPLNYTIALTKRIPTGGGLGGGSGNAAYTLRTIKDLIEDTITDLSDITSTLGSDITAFLYAPHSVIMEETGNKTSTITPYFPDTPILLVNGGQNCPTPEIYARMTPDDYARPVTFPLEFTTVDDMAYFLKFKTRNSMTRAALAFAPEIQQTLDALENQRNCQLARLSGSGSTCFGIFPTVSESVMAAEQIKTTHPDWWVVTTILRSK
ncbi:MAG: 4-(cytidine 5'-diphospho)-2-C-methyl-D-erythritol kinase [Pseudobdellovibrionaceae bacterium]|jgi:4-diphosphocytidyl-2-C-methyl-D-erythritol kinase|nr:4-(cytidine 5'-diphospho)-2-C-methyl-D-erythritol kinase [Pseudobdellovibrionaceae bacterium]